MLAHPYGYPMVMSSYAFEDDQQGPPPSSPLDRIDGCGSAWICEHRRDTIASMLAFRKAVDGAGLANWHIVDGKILSFSRGDKGHVVINTGDDLAELGVSTSLPQGDYTDLLSRDTRVTVDAEGLLTVAVAARSVIAVPDTREE
jgi:alpha-amylase